MTCGLRRNISKNSFPKLVLHQTSKLKASSFNAHITHWIAQRSLIYEYIYFELTEVLNRIVLLKTLSTELNREEKLASPSWYHSFNKKNMSLLIHSYSFILLAISFHSLFKFIVCSFWRRSKITFGAVPHLVKL